MNALLIAGHFFAKWVMQCGYNNVPFKMDAAMVK